MQKVENGCCRPRMAGISCVSLYKYKYLNQGILSQPDTTEMDNWAELCYWRKLGGDWGNVKHITMSLELHVKKKDIEKHKSR